MTNRHGFSSFWTHATLKSIRVSNATILSGTTWGTSGSSLAAIANEKGVENRNVVPIDAADTVLLHCGSRSDGFD